MKKLLALFGFIALISACSDRDEKKAEELTTEEALEQGETIVVRPQIDITFEEGKIYAYGPDNLQVPCSEQNEALCAIDAAAKCTINPKMEQCDKKKMPKFIFMEDESLERPTEMSYEIVKVKPLDANNIEIYTKGDCNGGWFGLCKGNIIYVLSKYSGSWAVKDIYAMENI